MKLKNVKIIIFLFIFTFNIFLLNTSVMTETNNTKKLDFAFLLHANQANVPYGDVANNLCYHAVLETMLDHPSLHFPLHFSGTLLIDLAWFNGSTLDLIRQGISSGQFEIIGSTYAQNVMYSHNDDYDNELQIEKHRQVIKEILNVEPTGFWNPERCWNQERYVNLISGANYRYTLVEDHILKKSTEIFGNDEYKVRNTTNDEYNLFIFNDDKWIINNVDNIAFTTEPASSQNVISAVDNLIDFLWDIHINDLNDDYCVVYGQDMEVWGLWQEEGRPSDSLSNVISRLDYLFEQLEAESSWLNVITPSEFLNSLPADYEFEHISDIVNGSADWMEGPSINEGYKNWFDFSANDSRLNEYRMQFEITRERLKEIDTLIIQRRDSGQNTSNSERLMSYAKFVFAANQYEFGCIGCYFPWYYRIKSSLLTAEAAYYALEPSLKTETVSMDLDFDGNNEFILRNQLSMFIFTGHGGRLINWFDIKEGEILLANDLPNTYATWTVQGLDYDSGTPLSSPVSMVTGNDLWGRTTKKYRLRPKSFVDEFEDLEVQWFWKARNRSTMQGENYFEFIQSYSNRKISKIFLLNDHSSSLLINYSITNNENYQIQPTIELSFSPGNEKILFHGKAILDQQILSKKTKYEIFTDNTMTRTRIKATLPKSGLLTVTEEKNDPVFAKEYTLVFEKIDSEETLVYSFILISKSMITNEVSHDTSSVSFTTPGKSSEKTQETTPIEFFVVFNALLLILIAIKLRKKTKKEFFR